MSAPARRPLPLVRGVALSFALPLVLFVAAVLMKLGHRAGWSLPQSVNLDAPPHCQGAIIRPSIQTGVEPPCSKVNAEGKTDLTTYVCDPPSWRDEQWVMTLEVDTRDDLKGCGMQVYVLDRQLPPISRSDAQRAYEHVSCSSEPERITCSLSGRPWRTYVAVPVARDGAFAGQPVVIAFAQSRGLNLRRSAVLLFATFTALGGLAMWALYGLRPRGPRGLFGLERSRWVAVAASSGAGGAVSGMLFALRPADFGGYEEPPRWEMILAMTILVSALVAVTGCFSDLCRRLLNSSGRRVDTWIILVMFVVLVTAVPWYVREGLSAHVGPRLAIPWPAYDRIFYAYFALSVASPLLLFHEPARLRQLELGTGAIPPTRSSAARLFGCTILMGVLACLIGYIGGDILAEPIEGQIFSGFYKPASALGVLISSMPLLAALSFAVNLGEERPAWVQRLETHVSGLLRNGARAERAMHFRSAVLVLLEREHEITPNARFLGRAAVVLSAMWPLLNAADIEQLAGRRSTSDLETRLAAVLSALKRVRPQAVEIRTSLLLIDRAALAPVLGELVVSTAPQPDEEPEIVVCQNGMPAHFNAALERDVRRTVKRALDVAGRERDGRRALAGSTVFVDFRYQATSGIVGESYELPLALTVWALATRTTSMFASWTATGAVNQDLEVLAVEALELKRRAPGLQYDVLLTAAGGLAAATSTDEEAVRCWRLSRELPRDIDRVAREIQTHVRHGGRAIVGVEGLAQAIVLLFGSDT